jgi:subtilisin-like proprotein convertase family protein
MVAGVAALVLSINPDLTAQQVKGILQDTADQILDPHPDPQLGLSKGAYDSHGHSQWFGYGKVNAAKAVRAAQQMIPSGSRNNSQLQAENRATLVIPDNNLSGVKSEIAISLDIKVEDIQVTVDITHDFLGDIEIYLIAPNSKRILLQSRTLGRNTSLQTTYTMREHPGLKQLISLPAPGSWELQVIDYSPQDVGHLNSWILIIGY